MATSGPWSRRLRAPLLAAGLVMAGGALDGEPPPAPAAPRWELRPSLRYDLLCVLNPLSGDPFYAPYYPETIQRFAGRLSPQARAALDRIREVLKVRGQGIISAKLCLYFSVLPGDDLEGLVAACREPGDLQRALRRTPYWSEDGWKEFLEVRDDLRTVLEDLRRIGFVDHWRRTVLPEAERACAAARQRLKGDRVAELQEQVLGRPLEPPIISVRLLAYAQPHGIKVTGSTFLTDLSYPLEIVLRNGAHEMLHPPFDLAHDPVLRKALETLRQDPCLMDKVDHHNPSFGYNSFLGFVEEDVVQAFEQAIASRCGFAQDPRQRWRSADDGMHVLAVALYSLLEREPDLPPIRAFLLRAIDSGALAPGRIQPRVEAFFGTRPPAPANPD